MPSLDLQPHPGNSPAPLSGIQVQVRLGPAGRLALRYRLRGDPERLAIPAPLPAGRGQRLWEQGCCEAFLTWPGCPGYQEYNFSWSGLWALYGFDAYRQGGRDLEPVVAPRIRLAQDPQGLTLDADLVLAPPPSAHRPPRLALTTVVATRTGQLSYWALAHPPGAPDFHHPAGFLLDLEPTESPDSPR